jgi:beta-glucanase (GH16 family)
MPSLRTIAPASLALAGCFASGASPNDGKNQGSNESGQLQPASVPAGATTRSITLRTAVGGLYVTAENGGGGAVNANRPAASTWETFTLYDLNGGALQSGDLVALGTLNGHFVCAENGGGGEVNATRTDPQSWETFRAVKIGGSGAAINDGDQIALQTEVAGLYVSAINGGGANLLADRTAASGWEAFVVGGDAPAGGASWTLVWSDEFDGPAGSAVDGSKWGFDTGGGGWGNNELENYTSRTSNVRLDGASHLEIVARAESFGGNSYTSGRINTAGRFTQRYGRFEARIKMPSGAGIWPAFWSLGDNIGSLGWPTCGELDIMEAVRDFTINHGSAHGPGYSGGNPLTATYKLPSGSLSDDFHVYAIEWEPNQVRWYVDNTLYETRTPADLPAGTSWVYDHPFFLLLNLAVGGNFPGPPDASTVFPATMTVDYVRVYTR